MIDSLLGVNPYLNYYQYGQYNQHNRNLTQTATEQTKSTQQAQATGKVHNTVAVTRAADPDTPVQPVQAVPRVDIESSGGIAQLLPFLREGADPAEMAVRMRMKTYDPEKEALEVEKALHDKTVQKRLDDKLFANKPENPINKARTNTKAAVNNPDISSKSIEEIIAERAESSKRTLAVRENARKAASPKTDAAQEKRSVTEPEERIADSSAAQNTARTVSQVQEAEENSTPIQKRKPFFAVA